MIPLYLRVRNFLCYRDDVRPLDFSGIHLACLTGANGHGKSALLDAITWAVWGKARARYDDDLIHHGQTEMEVEFAFDLGGIVYRILRKRDSSKGGRSLLDLQVEHQGGYRSIAEPTMRATQAAIIRLLRMDYETFTNSAFLLQGRADAFTTRTPADRKKVLGEILGLSLYDEYEERAKVKARESDRQVAELEAVLRDIDRELSRLPEYEELLRQAEASVSELSAAVREAETRLDGLRRERQALEHRQARLADLDRRLAQAARELDEIEAGITERQRRLAYYEKTLSERAQIEAGYAALDAARRAEADFNERLAHVVQIQSRQHGLERQIETARRELELAAGRLGERIRELEWRAAEGPRHEQELARVRARLERLERQQAERQAVQERIQVLRQESAGLQVRNDQLRQEMEAIREKLDLLQAETAEATCPLCGQRLSVEHRAQLAGQFEEEGKTLADAHRENAARRRAIAAEVQQLEVEAGQLDRELSKLAGEQRTEGQLEQALSAARQAAADLEPAGIERAALEGHLAARDYAAIEQAELGRLAGQLEALGYDARAHDRARAQVADLARHEEAHRQLVAVLERIDEERAAVADLSARQARWLGATADDLAERERLGAAVAKLPEIVGAVNAQVRTLDELQAQSSRARQALGAAQQLIDHCGRLAVERERRAADRQRAAEDKAAFDELRLAFGKKGIQAMVIEASIPEIEYEANRLLSRMTGGRMHIRLETQRETQKGDTIETLDINIADELGTRSYEMFSGGEAFRVNFAIRIALSRLLARRAGAQLQLLIIDEGFGTQDAEGRERLVEAINSIQDDFARILVITHIEELREAFPVRIEVTKTAYGSQVSLN